MRRFHPLWMSAAALIIALAATVVVASVVGSHGHDAGGVILSILTSVYTDELIPRLVLAALIGLGGFLFIRSESRRPVLVIATACAVTGLIAGAIIVVRAEMAFDKAFPQGGVALGWAPGAARAEFLPVIYLVAWVQVSLGFAASTLLVAISGLRKRVQP